MMKNFPKLKTWLFCLGLAAASSVQAQNPLKHQCGINFEDQYATRERMFENRLNRARLLEEYGTRGGTDMIYVPIQYHLIADDNGNGRAEIEGVYENLCRINDDYANQNVRFYLAGLPHYINNSVMYDNEDRGLVGYLMVLYKQQGVVNIYVGNSIGSMGGLGTTLGYYTPGYDVIYAIRQEMSYSSKTLSHELGHYFTLAHPFFGWDGQDPYEVITANGGNTPIDMGGVLVENVVRGDTLENCQVAADGFCDTDLDYDFGIFVFGCDFFTSSYYTTNGPVYDPQGVELLANNSVDESLIMSYFGDACTNKFSEEQKEAMKLDMISRGYDNFTPPTLTEVSAQPTLVYPTAATNTQYYEGVEFSWNAAPGATHYVFIVERMFGGQPIETVAEQVVDGTKAWVTLQPSRQYRWYVRPFNLYDVCTNFTSATETFNSGTLILGLESQTPLIESASLMPNPVQRDQEARLEIKASANTQATISISNVLGQPVMSAQKMEITAGSNVLQFPVQQLAAGMYLINIDTNKGKTTLKMVVSE